MKKFKTALMLVLMGMKSLWETEARIIGNYYG